MTPPMLTRPRPYRLLLLGGTVEAAQLARAIIDRFPGRLEVTTSLAGRTEQPGPLPGNVRIGGFGGAAGLADYLAAEAIDLLVDATHPFAAQISAHARQAAEARATPRLCLARPPWRRHPLDRWIEVADLAGAASVLTRLGRRALLTVGADDLGAFAAVDTVFFLVRLIDPPRQPLPLADYEVTLGRGPFTTAGERHLMLRHKIDVLVTKASGGSATEAKIVAAREASIPVVMVRRPVPEPGERVDTVEAALAWIARRLALLERNLRPLTTP